MSNLIDIINYKDHPLENSSYINYCRKEILDKSILVLNNFITKKCLDELILEALNLENKAFYCSQNHTILLEKHNIEVKSDKGCVPHDLVGKNSKLNIIYKSNIFKKFIKNVLSLNELHSYSDSLSSINYNYYQKTQQLGWHFDNASFAITLMIQCAENGGDFEYVSQGRDYKKNLIDKSYLSKIINNSIKPKKINADAGTLVLFLRQKLLA